MDYRGVLYYGFLGLSLLAIGRRIRGGRWLGIPLLAVLLTPITLLFIEALFRGPDNHARFFYMWPFPYPNVFPNAFFWLVAWGIAAFFWIPRPAPPPSP